MSSTLEELCEELQRHVICGALENSVDRTTLRAFASWLTRAIEHAEIDEANAKYAETS